MSNPKMKKCKVCGEMVAKNAHTCPHCGAKLKVGGGCLTTVFRFLIAPIILFILYWAWVQYTYHKAVEETVDAYTQAVEEAADAYSKAIDEAAQSYSDAVNETVDEMNKAFSGY